MSQRYNEEEFSNEIVGEVENNGTEPVEFVQVTANFYDGNGGIVGTESTYSDPSDLGPGMKAPFKIYLLSGSPTEDSATYEFTIQWENPDGSTGVNTVKGEGAGESGDGQGENISEEGEDESGADD